jgi:hypothetical protein
MFPSNYFNLFPPFPREDKIFVAMSFDPLFDNRWKNVIEPAIRRIKKNDVPLEPYRVDTRRISDSILTEILTGISRSLVIFADVTSLGKFEDKPIRNGNVMYEVGLAHAIRLPEEVILFRSDNDELLFDVANVRVNSYDPDGDPEKAGDKLGITIMEAIKEIDLKRNLSIKATAESLDYACWEILLIAATEGGIHSPPMKTFGEVVGNGRRISAISRLLELGVLKTNYLQITPELLANQNDQSAEKLLKYELTQFGIVLFDYVTSNITALSLEEIQKHLENYLEAADDSTK